MSSPESDPHTEVLKSIAASLKGIQASLDQLTGAVEGVAESIEKAHEPEGDLGVHLVGALKELTSSLHKRAQQERSFQPQQHQRPQHQSNQNRRDDRQQRPQRQENRTRDPKEEPSFREEREDIEQPDEPLRDVEGNSADPERIPTGREENPPQDTEKGPRPKNRGRRGGTPPRAKQTPKA
jgi:hypothetical protein